MRRTAAAIVCSALALGSAVAVRISAEASPPDHSVSTGRAATAPRSVMYVGNNWDGTATSSTPARTPRSVGSTWCPTTRSGSREIRSDPERLAYFR